MKRTIVLCILCATLLCACFAAQNEKKHISGAADSAVSGCTVGVADTNDSDTAVSDAVEEKMGKKDGKEKPWIITDMTKKKRELNITKINTKDKGEWMGWINSSAEYSQVSDDHYYYVRKKDKNLYTLYRDKGEDVGDFNIPEGYQFRGCGRYNDQFYVFIMPEENLEGYKLAVVDFSLNKTKDLGIFPGMLPNMIFYHDKAYGYARLYLDEGALLEVRDMMTGNRLDSVLQKKRDSYSLDGDISGDCIVDGGLYFTEMKKGKELHFFRRDLESGTEEKIFGYEPKKEKSVGKCWGGTLEMDQGGIFFQEYRESGNMLYFVPWSGNKMEKITSKAITSYAYNSRYIFYIDNPFQLHRWNRETRKEEKVLKTPIKDDFTMNCTEKGVYIQELSEYSYPLYYIDIEGEKIEAIYGKSNLKAS